jgi:hypothetical protein
MQPSNSEGEIAMTEMTIKEQLETILDKCDSSEELQIIKEIIMDYLAPQENA